MDPTATWLEIADAIKNADWELAANKADDLLEWLGKDGMPPIITGTPVFDKIVAKAACTAISRWEC